MTVDVGSLVKHNDIVGYISDIFPGEGTAEFCFNDRDGENRHWGFARKIVLVNELSLISEQEFLKLTEDSRVLQKRAIPRYHHMLEERAKTDLIKQLQNCRITNVSVKRLGTTVLSHTARTALQVNIVASDDSTMPGKAILLEVVGDFKMKSVEL